jgi:hypothetical protein
MGGREAACTQERQDRWLFDSHDREHGVSVR